MTSNQSNTQAHKKQVKRDKRKRGEEKAKVFKNRFRSGGEENERQMANNVMRGIRVCDGYLVCLDLATAPEMTRCWESNLDLARISPAMAPEILLATS